MNKEAKTEKDWRTEKRKTGGSIKTVKGKLYARIQNTDEQSGKRKEKLRPATTRTHARALVEQMRRELEQGGQTALRSDKLSFLEVAEKYEKIKLIPPVFQNGIKVAGARSFQDQIYLLKPLREFFGQKVISQHQAVRPRSLQSHQTACARGYRKDRQNEKSEKGA
ncbi:MAG: hypothetical protein M3Q33_10035 [Acidobacteriota bacterium]|nr:hypothetical protein [Acidobacteriota bacterium]